MPRNAPRFRVAEKQIPDIRCHEDALLGVVKVQMPEQCGAAGSGTIIPKQREYNIRIIQNTIARFGHWAQQVKAPAIFLFPEFSVTEEATDWLRTAMANDCIAPNTLIVLGMEQLSANRFMERVTESQSREDFADVDFGPNIDRINTAVIFAKNNFGNVYCYYQPKCSRSDYESLRQFKSNLIYKFAFGYHSLAVSICSDFLLRDDTGTLVGSFLQDVDRLHANPRDHRLDLILLIQKNPSPLHSLYHNSIWHLFYNRPHNIQTTDTIICAVNSVNPAVPGRFGKSNVSVMRRGRPPREYANRYAHDHFAWCSLEPDAAHINADLHYVRWRLRCPGAISFILDTRQRPWVPGSDDSLPVDRVGLHEVTKDFQIQDITPIPEVYELLEVLYCDFNGFINATFSADALRQHFGSVQRYERLLIALFPSPPRSLLKLLLSRHKDVPVNCDHWNQHCLEEVFKYFVLTLRLLSERYTDLRMREDLLHADARTFGIVDCNDLSLGRILDILTKLDPIDVLLLQRFTDLTQWDGKPISLAALNARISITKPATADAETGCIARAPSPKIASIVSVISDLNGRCKDATDIRNVLNDTLRFA